MSFGTALCKFLSLYQSVMNGTCEQVHQLWYLYLHFVQPVDLNYKLSS